MIEEQFDVVDINNRPTGELTTKDNAHKLGTPHRVAAVHVFTKSDIMLVQLHKNHGRLRDHSIGGHVSAGETYLQAAIREAQEELGINTKLEEVALGVGKKVVDPRPEFSKIIHIYGVYKTYAPPGWKFEPNEEVDSLIEMKVEDLVKDMNSHPENYLSGFLISFDAYLSKINHPKRIRAYGQNWGEL